MFSCIKFVILCSHLHLFVDARQAVLCPIQSVEPSITLSKFLGNLKGDGLHERLLSLTLLQGSVLFFDCNCFMSRKRVGGSEGVVHEML